MPKRQFQFPFSVFHLVKSLPLCTLGSHLNYLIVIVRGSQYTVHFVEDITQSLPRINGAIYSKSISFNSILNEITRNHVGSSL